MPIVSHATEADLELFRRELDSFVPDTICDAHMHLWAKTHLPPTGYDAFRELEEDVIDLAAYRRRMAELLPGRRVAGGLILPGAVGALGEQVAAQNAFTAAEAAVRSRLARRDAGLAGDGPRIRPRGGAPPGSRRAEVLPRA